MSEHAEQEHSEMLFTGLPSPHINEHRKWSWADERSWKKHLVMPFSMQGDYQKYSANPVLKAGNGANPPYDNYWARAPSAIHTGSKVWIFYTGHQNDQLSSRKILLAESAGINNFKDFTGKGIILEPEETWEAVGVRYFKAIVDQFETDPNKKWKALYMGQDSEAIYRIGYAYSPTGLPGSWVKYSGNPITVSADMLMATSAPTLLRLGRMYYCLFQDNNEYVRVAVSKDMINWTTLAEPLIIKGESGEWDDYSLWHADICWISGTFYIVYVGCADVNNWDIGLASSFHPFKNYTKFDQNPVLVRDAAPAFDWQMCAEPSLLVYEDDFKIYYMGKKGNGEGDLQIGLASLTGV